MNAFESKFAYSAVSDFKSNINAVSPLLLCYPEFFMIISYAQSFSIIYGLYLHICIVTVWLFISISSYYRYINVLNRSLFNSNTCNY